jgi:catechol 2,3-dioxygenase-like lactoylglutathione lyase family enzyme
MPKLDHVAIEVSDMDASIEFYTKKMNFSFVSRAIDEKENEEYCYLESEGFSLELLFDQRKKNIVQKKVERPYCPHICFATDNMSKTLEELKLKNIEIVHGPLLIENEATWVYFVDPNMNVLEYIQRF